ncbi:MAG: hypothetical protein K6G16_05055, partial [Lachnospiraceae bacterium]|nr:hypothetical protein [Lachnospiraceae bacterium]
KAAKTPQQRQKKSTSFEFSFLESALKPYIILLVLWFPNGRIWLISGHLSGLFVVFLSYHPVPTPLKPLILLTFSAE